MPKNPDDIKKFLLGTQDDIGSMFEMFARMHSPYVLPSDHRWFPLVDVFETDEDFIVILDISHIDPKDIEIIYKNMMLHVKGIRRELTEFKKRHYHKMEIDYGPFERKIDVPAAIDEQNIKTKYKDGFLRIKLKKIKDRRSTERKIDIEWKE